MSLGLGCSSSPPEPTTPNDTKPSPQSRVDRYLPLQDNTVYAYETVSEDSGETGVLMMQITRPRPGRVDLNVGGRVQRLEIVDDGVRHVSGGYVLRAPLTVDARWKGNLGTVRVARVDVAADVPAGKFVGCIEVIEEAAGTMASRTITTLFCPDVGIVSLDAEGVSDTEYAKERAVLKSFGPRIDLEQ